MVSWESRLLGEGSVGDLFGHSRPGSLIGVGYAFGVAFYGVMDRPKVVLSCPLGPPLDQDLGSLSIVTFAISPGCDRVLFVSALRQAGQLHLPLLAAPLHLQCG